MPRGKANNPAEKRRKLQIALKGRPRRKGWKHTEATKLKMSLKARGKGNPMYGVRLYGSRCSQWKGGLRPLRKMIIDSYEYIQWREQVYQRDGYTCQECGKLGSGDLHCHHIIRFAKLVDDFLKEYNQFSPLEDRETLARLVINYKPFWDTDNGQTLCIECHKQTKTYARNFRNTNTR